MTETTWTSSRPSSRMLREQYRVEREIGRGYPDQPLLSFVQQAQAGLARLRGAGEGRG